MVIGPGTQQACDQAIDVARKLPDALILLTATVTSRGKRWDKTPMGKAAQRYINTTAPDCATAFHEAHWLNTLGEVVALAEVIERHEASGHPVERVIITVKSWHAYRTKKIVEWVFAWKRIRVPVEIRRHKAIATAKNIAHEAGGLVVNWFRIQRLKFA